MLNAVLKQNLFGLYKMFIVPIWGKIFLININFYQQTFKSVDFTPVSVILFANYFCFNCQVSISSAGLGDGAND